jgi:hypothetical protein
MYVAPKILSFCDFFKLPQVDNHRIGENWPNLVTLLIAGVMPDSKNGLRS